MFGHQNGFFYLAQLDANRQAGLEGAFDLWIDWCWNLFLTLLFKDIGFYRVQSLN